MSNTYVGVYLSTWNKILTIKGRANREEYWFFAVGNGIISILFFLFLPFFTLIPLSPFLTAPSETANLLIGSSVILWMILIFLANITLTIRRLHDFNASGWWLIAVVVIPFANLIIGLIRSTVGENRFGPQPD